MQAIRNDADYSDEGVRKKLASEQLCMAKEMLTLIGKELKQ